MDNKIAEADIGLVHFIMDSIGIVSARNIQESRDLYAAVLVASRTVGSIPSVNEIVHTYIMESNCDCIRYGYRHLSFILRFMMLNMTLVVNCETVTSVIMYITVKGLLPDSSDDVLNFENGLRFQGQYMREPVDDEELKTFLALEAESQNPHAPCHMNNSNRTENLENLKSLKAMSADTCSICRESINEGDDVFVLPCKHMFHAIGDDCLGLTVIQWLENSNTCPNCNAMVKLK